MVNLISIVEQVPSACRQILSYHIQLEAANSHLKEDVYHEIPQLRIKLSPWELGDTNRISSNRKALTSFLFFSHAFINDTITTGACPYATGRQCRPWS